MNLYQHAKNQAISLICSGDMVDWKILQFDWLRTFWPISQESEFSQISDLCRNTANNIDFHYRTNSVKINDKIFQYTQKKSCFCPIFPNFLGKKKKKNPENPALSHTTSYRFLASCQNLEKYTIQWYNYNDAMIQFQENT